MLLSVGITFEDSFYAVTVVSAAATASTIDAAAARFSEETYFEIAVEPAGNNEPATIPKQEKAFIQMTAEVYLVMKRRMKADTPTVDEMTE